MRSSVKYVQCGRLLLLVAPATDGDHTAGGLRTAAGERARAWGGQGATQYEQQTRLASSLGPARGPLKTTALQRS